jgi:hypothetical protein
MWSKRALLLLLVGLLACVSADTDDDSSTKHKPKPKPKPKPKSESESESCTETVVYGMGGAGAGTVSFGPGTTGGTAISPGSGFISGFTFGVASSSANSITRTPVVYLIDSSNNVLSLLGTGPAVSTSEVSFQLSAPVEVFSGSRYLIGFRQSSSDNDNRIKCTFDTSSANYDIAFWSSSGDINSPVLNADSCGWPYDLDFCYTLQDSEEAPTSGGVESLQESVDGYDGPGSGPSSSSSSASSLSSSFVVDAHHVAESKNNFATVGIVSAMVGASVAVVIGVVATVLRKNEPYDELNDDSESAKVEMA